LIVDRTKNIVVYGGFKKKHWSLTLREEHRLRVFESRLLRRMFGLKRDEVTDYGYVVTSQV
jgi:hypothetical protein